MSSLEKDAARPLIKVMGERNSGTNFLERVLRDNFDVELAANAGGVPKELEAAIPGRFEGRWTSRRAAREAVQDQMHDQQLPANGGWKHAAATSRLITEFARPRSATIIFLVRHPVSWAQSMHRNPFHGLGHIPKSFEQFLKTPWVLVGRDELGMGTVPSILHLLKAKVNSYAECAEQNRDCHVVRYEDVLKDPQGALGGLGLPDPLRGSISLPEENARSFGRNRLKGSDYAKKATDIGFHSLTPEIRALFAKALDRSAAAEMYASA